MKRADGALDAAHALKCELACEVLRSFGNLCFSATGWSMLPTLWPGDTLVVDRVTRDLIKVGDVVLVGRDGRLCAHRVVAVAGDSRNPHWLTQGDAMLAPDRPVNENELLGRVAYVIRAGRLKAVPSQLSVAERLTAEIVRRSVPAARALVYLHRMIQTPQKPSPQESILPCQG
jgi:hypothetical protein